MGGSKNEAADKAGFLDSLFRLIGKPGKKDASGSGGPPAAGKTPANGGRVWLIVGLGNPGAGYESTRHNVGFQTADRIAEIAGIQVQKSKFRALTGEGLYGGDKIVLIKPQTYMNLSGEAVRQALRFYKADCANMIVVYDDVDIELGKIRIRAFGGPGSHNGMRSIADSIGEDAKFPRIRIGIGKQPEYMELRDFVLRRFSPDEAKLAESAVSAAAAAALDIVKIGIENAMNAHNPKRRDG